MARDLTPEQARAFARAYVTLVEALLAEGVPEADARHEARWTAREWALDPDRRPDAPWGDPGP